MAALQAGHFYYGTVAASERMLQYFGDINTKDFAYQALVKSIDEGYPFSLSNDFISGDLELTTVDNFAQSYNLYKATSNSQKSMSKWAESYFSRIDKVNFSKYLFYKALEAIRTKKTDDALQYLDQTLQSTKGPEQAALAQKAARTLARLLYEQTQYKQSLDIYQNYLLKLNPMEPGDWIEAAWCLYRLGRFDEALGYLFNLQAKPQETIYLEQFVIRSLVYREKCDADSTEQLNQTFDHSFGPTLEGIKTGRPLKIFPLLRKIYFNSTEYDRPNRIFKELELEKKRLSELPKALRPMATFLYTSEMNNLEHQKEASEEEALQVAARSLVTLSESLRFLKFDVAREKFNPDKVFAPETPPKIKIIETEGSLKFEIHWIQWGDFWRDERILYKAILQNRCE